MPALVTSRIIGVDGQPLKVPKPNGPRTELTAAFNQVSRRQPIEAKYDAASSSTEFANYWANTDSYDADSANSKGVRQRLVHRSRYEVANNGFMDGCVQTLATDLVGIGPRLRMQSGNKGFNQAVETVWNQWSKRVQLRRKLWTMAHAKVQDGEAFAIAKNNPRLRHPVKLDIVLVETEQVQSLQQPSFSYGYIDGMRFDSFGNVESFDVLKYHPGGPFANLLSIQPESVPAKFVLHWFLMRRPGQHRGVPEFRSTLQVGAASRRWREATIAAAETAADISMFMTTNLPPDNEADAITPMSTMEFQKRMAVAAPMGWDIKQVASQHPGTNFAEFHKTQINEFARPKSMPYNKAACDSSSYNYASGRLDHQTYYGSLDVEREDANDLVLDKLFELFWEEAVLAYGWNGNPNDVPAHSWDWPKHPVADISTEADANDKNLKNGSLSLSQLYSANGQDFEDELTQMASDYGVSEDDMRAELRVAIFNDKNQQASIQQAENQAVAKAAKSVAVDTNSADGVATTATEAATTGDVQASALNGAQITAMVAIAAQQAQGSLPVEASRAMLKAAFPLMDIKLINVIADEINKQPIVKAPSPFPPRQGAPNANE